MEKPKPILNIIKPKIPRYLDVITPSNINLLFNKDKYKHALVFYNHSQITPEKGIVEAGNYFASATVIDNYYIRAIYEIGKWPFETDGTVTYISNIIVEECVCYEDYLNYWSDYESELLDNRITCIDVMSTYDILRLECDHEYSKTQCVNYITHKYRQIKQNQSYLNILNIHMWFITNAMVLKILPLLKNQKLLYPLVVVNSDGTINRDYETFPEIIHAKTKLTKYVDELYPHIINYFNSM